MELSSVRALKDELANDVVQPMLHAFGVRSPLDQAAQPMSTASGVHRAFALGITRRNGADFRLAIRVQRRSVQDGKAVESIIARAKGEVDLRYIGQVVKRSASLQSRNRPLVMGASVAHYKVTAGTLGCFVEAGDGNICILSNNHVLANENDAQTSDPILQPGPLDGGQDPGDLVARLKSFVPLKTGAANTVDCAIAAVESGVDLDLATLTGLGTLSGSLQDISDSSTLAKVGRTTGVTRGSITAFEVDGVVVSYGIGSLTFDQQIEIDNVSGLFSNGGDSGSLIVDDSGKAVALLFAGSDQGGNKGLGLTYGNHIDNVLNALNVRLKFN